MSNQRFLMSEELAAYLRITESQLAELLLDIHFPSPFSVGNAFMFDRDEVDVYLRQFARKRKN
jgi:predicted DNA-binding transcriptional regulator AlpA